MNRNANVNYLEEKFKFFTAKICGHQICQVCLAGDALSKRETPCPGKKANGIDSGLELKTEQVMDICGSVIKKTQISDRSKEQLEYNREKYIRHQIKREFNLERDDFETSPEYRLYEETGEHLIYNKCLRIDEEWTEKQLEQNRKKYRSIIARNATRQTERNRLYTEQLREEAQRKLIHLNNIESSEKEAESEKQRDESEANLVKLGELSETTKEKKRREKELEKKRERMKQYEGLMKDQKPIQTAGALYWRHADGMLPKPLKVKPEPSTTMLDAKEKEINMQTAGGYDPTIPNRKIRGLLTTLFFKI